MAESLCADGMGVPSANVHAASSGVTGDVNQQNADAITCDVGKLSYQERKELGRCTRSGCPTEAADGHQLCEKHRAEQNRNNARYDRDLRAARKARGECPRCGTAVGELGCLPCRIRRGRVKSIGRDKKLDSASKFREHMHADGFARTRYHGQCERGAPSTATLDAQELAYALKSITKAVEGQKATTAAELSGASKAEIKAAEMTWLDEAALAVRFVDELLDRRRHVERAQQRAEQKQREAAKRERDRVREMEKAAKAQGCG